MYGNAVGEGLARGVIIVAIVLVSISIVADPIKFAPSPAARK